MSSASLFQQPLLKTPFHARARALSQLDSFIPWAGYTTVDVFSSVEHEYFAIRNATTLYDLTADGEIPASQAQVPPVT